MSSNLAIEDAQELTLTALAPVLGSRSSLH
jgi:hypothetical protein